MANIRMGRATEADVEAVWDFFHWLQEQVEEEPYVEIYLLEGQLEQVEASFNRVVLGYQTLVESACDPSLSYLDWKPEIKWLLENGGGGLSDEPGTLKQKGEA